MKQVASGFDLSKHFVLWKKKTTHTTDGMHNRKETHEDTRDRTSPGTARLEVGLLVQALTPRSLLAVRQRGSQRFLDGASAQAVDDAMDNLVSRLVPDLQRHLDSLVGLNLGPKENGDLAKAITRLLRRLGRWRLACPHCKQPAVLRYLQPPNRPNGVFRYEHRPSVRHGGTIAVGPLKIVPLPPLPPLPRR